VVLETMFLANNCMQVRNTAKHCPAIRAENQPRMSGHIENS